MFSLKKVSFATKNAHWSTEVC